MGLVIGVLVVVILVTVLMRLDRGIKKPYLIMCIVCLLIVPAQVHAQPGNIFDVLLGQGDSGIRLDRLTVSQMQMIPDSPRNDQPVVFRAHISNDSRRDVRIGLAIVDQDRVITQLNDVYLRPGNNQVDFPQVSVQTSRKEQRCFTIQTNVDRMWVPLTMASAFCTEGSKRDWRVDLSVEGLRMNPDPASPGEEVRFEVKIKNDGKQVRGDIRIQDSDQVVIQTDTINIPRGVTKFDLPRARYSFQRMDTCFTVIVDVDRTSHEVDASEEYCAIPTAWTLKSRKRDHRGDRKSHRGN